ncbi:hypothetical protein TrRE_jg10976, partial [Triparma retinervis]
ISLSLAPMSDPETKGDILLAQGDLKEAVSSYAASLSSNATPLVLLKKLLTQGRLEQFEAVVEDYNKLVSTGEASPLLMDPAVVAAASAYFNLGEFDASLDLLENHGTFQDAKEMKKAKTLKRKCQAEIDDLDGGLPALSTPATNDCAQEGSTKPPASPAPTPTPTPTTSSAAPLYTSAPSIPKYRYSQSDKFVSIEILAPNVSPSSATSKFEADYVHFSLTQNSTKLVVLDGYLFDEVDVDKCKVVYKSNKVVVKLRKSATNEWHELFNKADKKKKKRHPEDSGAIAEASSSTPGPASASPPPPPGPLNAPVPTIKDSSKTRAYASHRDWDAIEQNLLAEEESEKPEGEEALNKLFKQIYGNATDE